jgi:hypothetical protein
MNFAFSQSLILLVASFLLVLFFHLEDRGDMFLRNKLFVSILYVVTAQKISLLITSALITTTPEVMNLWY